ncbi:uncharacterized protein LOC133625094 [Colius striatus]|uniref:uncharacterized protein LOC133625094 n=1 Tax=Colius striatus TaxID=57412 RepID=UPI002B1D58AE|nr:uncharacterized protein LOC133625094 [Colius striatus]
MRAAGRLSQPAEPPAPAPQLPPAARRGSSPLRPSSSEPHRAQRALTPREGEASPAPQLPLGSGFPPRHAWALPELPPPQPPGSDGRRDDGCPSHTAAAPHSPLPASAHPHRRLGAGSGAGSAQHPGPRPRSLTRGRPPSWRPVT